MKKTINFRCQYCGLDALSKEHKIERRWRPVGLSGFFGDICVKAPREFNIAIPSGKL